MEWLFIMYVPVRLPTERPRIHSETAGPGLMLQIIYVKIDYAVGSRPSYIDPIPAQPIDT